MDYKFITIATALDNNIKGGIRVYEPYQIADEIKRLKRNENLDVILENRPLNNLEPFIFTIEASSYEQYDKFAEVFRMVIEERIVLLIKIRKILGNVPRPFLERSDIVVYIKEDGSHDVIKNRHDSYPDKLIREICSNNLVH